MSLALTKFKHIKAFFFDVDGVLSDGKILLTENGGQLRNMAVKDGYALKKAMQQGYQIAIISGGNSNGVAKRFAYLGVEHVVLGVKHKLPVFKELLTKLNLNAAEVLYMGDDIPDIPVLKSAGLACCPADAAIEVKEICHYISPLNGGDLCVRDVIEKTLSLNNQWFTNQDIR